MTRDEALGLLRERVVERFELPADAVSADARLVADLHVDSLDLVELTMDLEDELGIELPSEELAEAATVAALADLVAARVSAR